METLNNLPPDLPPIEDTPEHFEDISLEDAVQLGAVDSQFFYRTFFPKTFRQPSPPMHRRIDLVLDSPQHRFINLQCFRGSGKTTKLRAFAARRIAYRMSRTILVIGGSEPAASRSIQWMRGQIERNRLFRDTFGLRPGKKWHETEIEIVSDIDGSVTWVLGVGISSNIRGINFDDYRPDLIIGDDLLTDENILTKESRDKTTDLIMGAIADSLAPRSEEPNTKLALLQTPLHHDDASMVMSRSAMWHTERFPCWTPETEKLSPHQQVSSWPERFPTEELQQKKSAMFAMGKGTVFLREWEVRIVSSETAAFKPDLLQYYTDVPLRGTTVLSIDPVPPPSDREIAKNLAGKDWEAMVVQTRSGGNYYLRHYELMQGHDPSWTLAKAFELATKYQVSYIAVDAIAYQAVLKWLLETEMKRRGQYFVVIADKGAGKKSKYQKIVDAIGSLLQYKKYFIRKDQLEFLDMLTAYPAVPHEDLLDAVAIGLRALINPHVELGEGEYTEQIDESMFESLPLKISRRCP
jgi:phage terminase large subunit-like protein